MLTFIIVYSILFAIALTLALSLCKCSKLSDEEFEKYYNNQKKEDWNWKIL